MKCPNCGQIVTAEKFCTYCGYTLKKNISWVWWVLFSTIISAAITAIFISWEFNKTINQQSIEISRQSTSIAKYQATIEVQEREFQRKNYVIDSISSWQNTGINLENDSILMIEYLSGQWSVDYSSFKVVGPEGHSQSIDSQLDNTAYGCKVLYSAPFGMLIGRIGNNPAFKISRGVLIEPKQKGQLYLSINDSSECVFDNYGELTVKIMVVTVP